MQIAIERRDADDLAAGVAERVGDGITNSHRAGGNRACEAAEILTVAKHHLHGKAEDGARFVDPARHFLEMLDERRARIPVHVRGGRRNVVAENGRERDRGRIPEIELPAQRTEIVFDFAEHVFRPADEIHLVDGENDVFDADEVEDRRMTLGLLLDARSRIDEYDRNIGVRCPRRHVARVLLMAWRVDDDEAARIGIEILPGDVDGDALLAFGHETVEQHREVGKIGAGGLASRAADILALIFIKIGGIPEQAPDQRRLAVVNGTAGQKMRDAAKLANEVRHVLRTRRRLQARIGFESVDGH